MFSASSKFSMRFSKSSTSAPPGTTSSGSSSSASAQQIGNNNKKKWSLKNWLIGSKGLTSLVDELSAPVSSSSSSTITTNKNVPQTSSCNNTRADKVTSIVNRYRSFLTVSSSWELLSPQQILTCLGASSIPLYTPSRNIATPSSSSSSTKVNSNSNTNVGRDSDDRRNVRRASAEDQMDDIPHLVYHTSSSSAVTGSSVSSSSVSSSTHSSSLSSTAASSSGSSNTVVEAQFAEQVWSAALPSLQSFSVTMTSAEAASVVRSAHRLSVALPPSLLTLCAERFSSSTYSSSQERDVKFFQVFVVPSSSSSSSTTASKQQQQQQEEEDINNEQEQEQEEERQVKSAVSLMIRSAHAFSAQASLLHQQQQRHRQLAESKGMVKMMEQELNSDSHSPMEQEENNGDSLSSSKASKSKNTSSSSSSSSTSFPSELYQGDQIELCLELCGQATFSLLETCIGVSDVMMKNSSSSSSQNEDVDEDDDELRSLLLERQNHLLSLFSYPSLCIAVEAMHLCENYYYYSGKQQHHEFSIEIMEQKRNVLKALTKELIRRVNTKNTSSTGVVDGMGNIHKSNTTTSSSNNMMINNQNNNSNIFSPQTIRDSYSLLKTICQISASALNHDAEIISLANDFYVSLTHRLGTYVRKLAFAGPQFYEEFVQASIEMEKAALVLHQEQSLVLEEQQQQPQTSSLLSSFEDHQQEQQDPFASIFRGEKYSLDGPLVVESVANYFDHVLELHNTAQEASSTASFFSSQSFSNFSSYFYSSLLRHRKEREESSSSSSSTGKGKNNKNTNNLLFSTFKSGSSFSNSFLRNFQDVDQYDLLSSVAPLCIGSLSVWSDVEDVRVPAIAILTKSLRHLSPTHLVRVCQLVPKLRSAHYIGAHYDDDDQSQKSIKNDEYDKQDIEKNKKKTSSSLPVSVLTEKEYAHFIDELLAAIYVSHKDLPCVGCCLALRALAELSVVEKELLTIVRKRNGGENTTLTEKNENYDDDDEMNNCGNDSSSSAASPHVLPIGALSMCVQALAGRISELLEQDASSNNTTRGNSSQSSFTEATATAAAALNTDQRLKDSHSPLVKNGYQTMVVLEHVGVSLSMLGMLPGMHSSSDPDQPPEPIGSCGGDSRGNHNSSSLSSSSSSMSIENGNNNNSEENDDLISTTNSNKTSRRRRQYSAKSYNDYSRPIVSTPSSLTTTVNVMSVVE